MAENEILKKQVAELQKQSTAPRNDDTERRLREAQARVAALQSDKELLRLEKVALESRIKKMSSPTNAPARTAMLAYSSRGGSPGRWGGGRQAWRSCQAAARPRIRSRKRTPL